MLREELPTDLPVVFISAVTGYGLDELKDVLWRELNSESNKLQEITAEDTLVHRDKNIRGLKEELHDEDADEIEIISDEEVSGVEDIGDINEFEVFDPEEKA